LTTLWAAAAPVVFSAQYAWPPRPIGAFELDCLLLSQASIQAQSCGAMASDGATLKRRMARTNQVYICQFHPNSANIY